MPRSITIRDVPNEVVDELAARAAREGRSLQEYLKAYFVEITSKPDMATWIAQVEADQTANPVRVSTDDILAWRDADRR